MSCDDSPPIELKTLNIVCVQLWEPLGGVCVATLSGHSEEVLDVTFDLSGRLLASGSADGEELQTGSGSGLAQLTLSLSLDQARLVSTAPTLASVSPRWKVTPARSPR